jgi:PleD family two-component response regulator
MNDERERKVPLILIVDDVEQNIGLLYSILREEEYRFAVAENGKGALEALQREPPDLVLLDVMLPDLSGFEILAKMKEHEQSAGIPVIFITARSGIEDKLLGFEKGAVDYITKPFQDREVMVRVKTHLELKLRRDEQEELIVRLRNALDEVKQLRGIIPICAGCKSIRTDGGYWQQVEEYISSHSEIEFSHGLCPSCIKKLYPELAEEGDSSCGTP